MEGKGVSTRVKVVASWVDQFRLEYVDRLVSNTSNVKYSVISRAFYFGYEAIKTYSVGVAHITVHLQVKKGINGTAILE